METIRTVKEFRQVRATLDDCSVGFVPTMGALHRGHAALIERSVAECDRTVVSVYVNAAQFDSASDLDKYPSDLAKDCELAASLGADYVFAPTFEQMYPDDFRYKVTETEFSRELCGAHREGHFTGVLTVVMKLLNIVRPARAYFGEKDYQQLHLVKGMIDAFFLETEVVACPTVREADGLALSSRNLNLDCAGRALAPLVYKSISGPDSDEAVASRLTSAGFDVDYVVSKFQRRFVAARIGEGAQQVRLIDNVPLSEISD